MYWALAVVPGLIDIANGTLLVLNKQQLLICICSETSLFCVVLAHMHSTAQHNTAQPSPAQPSPAQHQRQRRRGGSQVLRGTGGKVQLSGVAQEVDGPMVEGVPRGRPGGALVIHIRHAGVVGLVEALIEGHTALPTCHTHMQLIS